MTNSKPAGKTSKIFDLRQSPDLDWLNSADIRPYIYMRKENIFAHPGSYLKECNWFTQEPLYRNPLKMSDVAFADRILNFEAKAFQKSGMPMPRWVFYDCSVLPGLICGFAAKTSSLSKGHRAAVDVDDNLEWQPISLFITIPTIRPGEWVAHNLCTTNALVEEPDRRYALGFLTKAFGLWYANVELLCGVTQWQSPAIRLHSHYGPFEILTAYTPVHSHARTLTYRTRLQLPVWSSFFQHEEEALPKSYQRAGFQVDPKDESSLKRLQTLLEEGQGPFFLDPKEIRAQGLDAPMHVYRS